ncbi:CTP synthase [Physcia stellaris]|nr:CTP synthase [Physcia stellaris]
MGQDRHKLLTMKYVLVSGGGMSGIGKGIIASSTGLLLKTMGLKVTAIKIDPYLNIGTMSPLEHGEVFVLDDGGEVDLDLGNYERYLQISLSRENNITTGKIYHHVIERERKGDYLDVCIIELGGTVGDIESAAFIESMRQLRMKAGNKENFLHIHVTYIPVIHGEQKTKLTQQAIRDVRKEGLFPDLVACRCEKVLEPSTVVKIAQWCQVEPSQVVAVHDVSSTYHVPVLLESQGMLKTLRDILRLNELDVSPSLLKKGHQTWHAWKTLTTSQDHAHETVSIALVGKYTNLHDSYLSVIKSLEHAAMACSRKLNLIWVDAAHLEPANEVASPGEYHKAWHEMCTAQGILVPGGFGTRGTEGMIAAVIEYARNVCDIPNAASIELDPETSEPVVIFMPEIDRANLGGTMRLGLRPTLFQAGSEWSKLRALYGEEAKPSHGIAHKPNGVSTHISTPQSPSKDTTANGPTIEKAVDSSPLIIQERHRHRYEVNPAYIDTLASNGMAFIGKDDKAERMEIMELKDHPWYVGVQYHPEYLSRVLRPSKPYLGFVAAASGCLEEIIGRGKAVMNGEGLGGLVDGIDGVRI